MGGKAKGWFRSLGISKKILIVLLSVSILPIFLVQFYSYEINASIIRKQTESLLLANLEQSANGVEDFFDRYDSIFLNISADRDYVLYMQPINSWNSRDYSGAKHELIDRLHNIAYVNPDILGIGIEGVYHDLVFYDSETLSGIDSDCFLEKAIWLPLAEEALEKKQTLYSGVFKRRSQELGTKSFFYLAHELRDFNNYQKGPVGSILICVNEAALSQVYQQQAVSGANETFMVNRAGQIISFWEKDRLGDFIFPSSRAGKEETGEEEAGAAAVLSAASDYIGRIRGKEPGRLSSSLKPVRDGQFYMVNVQDLNATLSNVKYVNAITILMGLLLVILCLAISIAFSEMTGRSVKKIVSAMNKACKGDYDVQIETEKNGDEFSQISDHFNDMIRRIKRSGIQEREALLREKNAEIKSLEAQINPHFLYNTLDTINWVAVAHEEFTVSRMLTSLAVILRYTIHKSNEIVQLKSELEYLKKYIYLQQQRLGYSFQCSISVDEELLSCQVHKLLIQPLIENAIVHGFPGNTGMDEIDLSIRKSQDGQIEIAARDNGKGMPKELAELLNCYDYKADGIETSIGIRNVITRLKLYYGERGSFLIESGGDGTVVTLVIPYEKEEP